jgi:hypothetical protein
MIHLCDETLDTGENISLSTPPPETDNDLGPRQITFPNTAMATMVAGTAASRQTSWGSDWIADISAGQGRAIGRD